MTRVLRSEALPFEYVTEVTVAIGANNLRTPSIRVPDTTN